MTALAKIHHYDRDLESAIVSHVLARPAALNEVLEHCSVDDFTSESLARILDAAQAIQEEGFTPSPVTIKPRLSGEIAQRVEVESGLNLLDFLVGLSRCASPLQKVAQLSRQLADMARRRRLDAELDSARERLKSYERPILEAVSGALEVIGEVTEHVAKSKGHIALGEAGMRMLKRLEDVAQGKPTPAVFTGLARIDKATGGFQAGDVTIVSGRPGMGKTLLLTNICRAAAVAGLPSILVELEMPREQIVQRLACDLDYDRKLTHQRSIAYTNLRSGKVSDAEFQRLFAVTQSMARLPFEIFEAAGMTAHEIVALLERVISKHKTMGVICVDYLQIIRATNRYAGSKVNEVTEISNALMQFAKRVKWPVVLGSQLNRAIEQRQEKRPTLADLRESGAIEQDADIVFGLHRPAYYIEQKRPANGKFDPAYQGWAADWNAAKNDLEIAVMKNRNGPPAVCNVHVDIFSGAIRNKPGDDQRAALSEDYYPEGYGG